MVTVVVVTGITNAFVAAAEIVVLAETIWFGTRAFSGAFSGLLRQGAALKIYLH
jgi:hypothetical protein